MPLLPDPELQSAIDKVMDETIEKDKAARRKRFIGVLLFLFSVLVCVEVLGLETGTKLSVVIMSCVLVMAWVVYDAILILHGSLVLVMAAVEWVGRKQLGEYKPPS